MTIQRPMENLSFASCMHQLEQVMSLCHILPPNPLESLLRRTGTHIGFQIGPSQIVICQAMSQECTFIFFFLKWYSKFAGHHFCTTVVRDGTLPNLLMSFSGTLSLRDRWSVDGLLPFVHFSEGQRQWALWSRASHGAHLEISSEAA